MALAQAVSGHDQPHVLALTYKLHPFFRITVLGASRSSLRSATSFFSSPFSRSSSRSRWASFTSSPPYFDFQVYSVASLTPSSHARSRAFAQLPPVSARR